MIEKNDFQKVTYDSRYDVLYVPSDRRTYGDEYGHIVLLRDMDNDEIVGLTIFDPVANEYDVKQELAEIERDTGCSFNLENLKSLCLEAVG